MAAVAAVGAGREPAQLLVSRIPGLLTLSFGHFAAWVRLILPQVL
jgi:hypothetical protein